MRKVCRPGTDSWPRSFMTCKLAHDRVALDALVEPEQSVGHGEDRVVAQLAFDVLADQERGRLPTGQVQRQALDEALELHFAGAALRLAHHGAERVHDDDARLGGLDLFDDAIENGAEVLVQDALAEVDEAECSIHLGMVEERELLLIAQHLDGRLAQHGEVQRRALRGGVGEHDLMRERGLAASRSAGDDIEGELGQAAAEDLIEAGHSGGQNAEWPPAWSREAQVEMIFAWSLAASLSTLVVRWKFQGKHRAPSAGVQRFPDERDQ